VLLGFRRTETNLATKLGEVGNVSWSFPEIVILQFYASLTQHKDFSKYPSQNFFTNHKIILTAITVDLTCYIYQLNNRNFVLHETTGPFILYVKHVIKCSPVHTTTFYGGLVLYVHSLITSPRYKCDWSALHIGCFVLEERDTTINLLGSWVATGNILCCLEKRNV